MDTQKQTHIIHISCQQLQHKVSYGKQHAEHLMTVLQEHYTVKPDWSGTRYIGIHLAWDYNKGQVHLFMPGYVQKALKQFQHMKKK